MAENQLATKTKTLKDLIQSDRFKAEIAASLPRHLKPDRFARIAVTAVTRTPKLLDCTRESLFRCLLDLSAAGLEPDGRHAHLVPYGKDCTLILDYKGIVRLIRQSGEISVIHADVVHENDDFEFSHGTGGRLVHRPKMDGDRGKPKCVYSYCRMKDGSEDFDVMTVEDVEKIRKLSKAGNSGPWKDHWGEMAKKTVIRRHSKMLPLAFETVEAIETADRGSEMKSANIPESDGSFFNEFSSGNAPSQAPDSPKAEKPGAKPDPQPTTAKSSANEEEGESLMVSDQTIEQLEEKMLADAVTMKDISNFIERDVAALHKLTEGEAETLLENWADLKG